MLTVQQAAEYAGRNPETIRRWIRAGKLPAQRFGSQHVVEEQALDEVLHGVRAAGLSDEVPADVRAALDWATRIVRRTRSDAR